MHSLSKFIFIVAAAALATFVSASPLAQGDQPQVVDGATQAAETVVPNNKAYEGVDSGPLPIPSPTASMNPSPRYTAPIKIVSSL